jgi:hypothetical protein
MFGNASELHKSGARCVGWFIFLFTPYVVRRTMARVLVRWEHLIPTDEQV